MAESDNLVRGHLERIQQDLGALRENGREVIVRLGAVERGLHDTRGEVLELRHAAGGLAARVDRIEHRLDLVSAAGQ